MCRMVFLGEVFEIFEGDMMRVMIAVMRCQLVEFRFKVFHVSRMIVQLFDGRLRLIEVDASGVIVIVRVEDVMKFVHCDRMILVNWMMFGREVLEVFKVDMMRIVIIVMCRQLVELVLKVFHVSRMFAEILDGRFRLVEVDASGVIVIVRVEN